jgi:5-methylcytosine-specific restriction endonuclease McrA
VATDDPWVTVSFRGYPPEGTTLAELLASVRPSEAAAALAAALGFEFVDGLTVTPSPGRRHPVQARFPAARRPVRGTSDYDHQYNDGVFERDRGLCQRCGKPVREVGQWSCHHRKSRKQGGADTPENRVLVCGSGTTFCHGEIHNREVRKARDAGYIVTSGQDPAAQAMWSEPRQEWVHLTPDYGVLTVAEWRELERSET